jgi:hypothetical protein
MPENVDKLISLARDFVAANGRIIAVRGTEVAAFRKCSGLRRLDYEKRVTDDPEDRTRAGFVNIDLALTVPAGEPPTYRWVALDSEGTVVGALSQSVRDGWIERIGTTGEVHGCGAALLMTAALSSPRLRIELLSLSKAHPYFARLGFDDVNGGRESDTLRHMVLPASRVARVRRAAPQTMSL